ncbi:MAG: hypothetical protein SVO26_05310 [Chloroflexota bacterium]|nr:hypothetical protein [Chloroflexota bacterium]
MDEIKSALERAMERAESLGKASDDERSEWKYVPEGERLAAAYLVDECDLKTEIAKHDVAVREHIINGVLKVLVRNIDLPRNDIAKQKNGKAMEAIKELKQDKASVEETYARITHVLNHYEQEGEQQRRQAYESVKRDVEVKVRQAAQQQMGASSAVNIDVEVQPLFKQEWRRVLGQLEAQYIRLLDEYKKELLGIP